MVQSQIEPNPVDVDWGSFKESSVDVLVHWNIKQVESENGLIWDYDEARLRVPLPPHALSKELAQEYLSGRYLPLLMLSGADIIPQKILDLEEAVLDIVGELIV